MYHIFFTPVCVDGPLGWFHIEADVDSAAINMEVQLPLWFLTLIPLEPILSRPLLDKNILERGAFKQNLTEEEAEPFPAGIKGKRKSMYCLCELQSNVR